MALTGRNTVQINETKTTVVENDQDVRVDVIQQDVEVILGFSGPQGPKGTDGTANIESFSYTHVQSTPASTWVINHTLGFYPNVTVVDSADSVVDGDIDYTSPTVITLNFSGAFSGKAYLS